MTETNKTTEIVPTADDWTFYGKTKPRRVAKPARAANDNRLTADRLQAIVKFRNEPDHPLEPLSSNWSVTPAGVVETEEDDEEDGPAAPLYRTELELEIKPSIQHILRAMRGEWEWFDKSEEYKGEAVKKIGKLQFSNGEQRERMVKTGPDGKAATYLCKIPRGAMLGATEKVGAPKGGSESSNVVTISNRNLTEMVMRRDAKGALIDPTTRVFIPKGESRLGHSYTATESRALIAEAIANTSVMPEVTVCPPGIASGTAKYSDQFIGMKPKSTGKSGAIGWVDFYTAARDREEWLATLDELADEDRAVLEAALSAQTLEDVGVAAGQSAEYARRKGGKRVMVAANDNLARIADRVAA